MQQFHPLAFDAIEVGQPHPRYIPRMPGPQFQVDTGGLTLMIAERRPTPMEVYGARRGSIHLGLLPFGMHTLFLLAKFEHLYNGWIDAPMAWARVPVPLRALPDRADDEGLPLTLTLVDAASGIVHALRMLTVTPTFARALTAAVRNQEANLAEYSEAAHEAEIAQAYRRFPDPTAMLRATVIVEKGGIPFNLG